MRAIESQGAPGKILSVLPVVQKVLSTEHSVSGDGSRVGAPAAMVVDGIDL